MPIASSNDIIIAGIADILDALNNPSLGAPIAPLTDNHVQSLRTLATLLTGIIDPPATSDKVPSSPSTQQQAPTPPLVAPAIQATRPSSEGGPSNSNTPRAKSEGGCHFHPTQNNHD